MHVSIINLWNIVYNQLKESHFYHYRSVETSSPLKALFLCVGLVILKVSNVLTDSWVIKCQNMQTYKIVVPVIPVISLMVWYQFPDPREPCDIRFYWCSYNVCYLWKLCIGKPPKSGAYLFSVAISYLKIINIKRPFIGSCSSVKTKVNLR